MGLKIELAQITLDEFIEAEEAFLTNSSWGVLPVVGVAATVRDGEHATGELQPVGGGCVGHKTIGLRKAYWDLVESETTV